MREIFANPKGQHLVHTLISVVRYLRHFPCKDMDLSQWFLCIFILYVCLMYIFILCKYLPCWKYLKFSSSNKTLLKVVLAGDMLKFWGCEGLWCLTQIRALEDCGFSTKKWLPVCVLGAAREIKTAGKKVAFEKNWEF